MYKLLQRSGSTVEHNQRINRRQIKIIVNGREQTVRRYELNKQYFTQHSEDEELHSSERQSNYVKKRPNKRKKSRGKHRVTKKATFRNLKPIWLSALSAIVIGSTFGLSMLSMFAGEDSIIENAEGKSEINSDDSSTKTEKELDLRVQVIQAGAFETKESAEAAAEQIRAKGLPVIIDNDEKHFRLYIGIGLNKEHLQAMMNEIEEKGVETYVKDIDIIAQDDLTKEEDRLYEGTQLLQAYIMDSERIFNKQKIEEQKKLSDKLATWKKDFDTKAVDDETKLAFAQSLLDADGAIKAFLNNDDQDQLWEAEKHLLQAFLLYKQIVSS